MPLIADFNTAYRLFQQCSVALVYDNTGYAPAWMDAPPGGLRHDAHVETAHTIAKTVCEMYGRLESGHLWQGLK